jgi:hypothetical protein
MTPESRNSPLVANGHLTHISVTISRNNPLLGNGSKGTFLSNGQNTKNNRGNVRHGDLHSVRAEVIKDLAQ